MLPDLTQKMFTHCKSLNLLYVEDDKIASSNIMKILKPFFNAVVVAYDGADGLKLYQEGEFDIVLTDIFMPILDGRTMSRKIKEINPEQVIIVISILEDIECLKDLIDIGISKFINKPLVLEYLLSSFVSTAVNINNAKKITLLTEQLKNDLKEAQSIGKLGSWCLNLKTGKLTWSDEIYELFEIDPNEYDPSYENFLKVIHPDDRELVNLAYQDSVKHHTTYNYVHRLLMPDGRIKHIREQGENFYNPDGTPFESRGTVHDITDQKEMQKSLISLKEAAEKANKTKSDFLANMSHEIRTPLNGVIGLTDLVLQTDLQPLQRDYLNKAETAAKALLNILNSILDYSKIEVHKMILDSIEFDISEILSNIQALFSYKAQKKNIALEVHIDDNVPKKIIGDPLRLQQILSNLVGNALKFTDSGYVRISISTITRSGRQEIKFEITDSGIGITHEQQKELFQPFSQVDTSFTRKFGGSGLGLMISKGLVELMGGQITLQSFLNKGSTFSFSISFDNNDILMSELAKKAVVRKQSDPLPDTKSIHILIVEDNDLNQLVASERLKQMGIASSIASNGLEALDMVKEYAYDAILMDIQMPVMDGLEATRKIRELKGKESLPIIALSAAVMQDDLNMAKDAGMNDHIAKPIDKVALQNVLAKWLIV